MNKTLKILIALALALSLCVPMSFVFASADDVSISSDYKVSLEVVKLNSYYVEGCKVATNGVAVFDLSGVHSFDGSLTFGGWVAIDHGVESYSISIYADNTLKFYGSLTNRQEGVHVSQAVVDNVANTGLDIVDFDRNARFSFNVDYFEYIGTLGGKERITMRIVLEACDSNFTERPICEINFVVDGKNYKCSHIWDNGTCASCGITCSHNYDFGVCTSCGYECPHDDYFDGGCRECDIACNHPKYVFANNYYYCASCGVNRENVCNHDFVNSKCTLCNRSCSHSWIGGACYYCDAVCLHDFGFGGNQCELCGFKCYHNWSASVCVRCGAYCNHMYYEGVCLSCYRRCSHNWGGGACTTCGVTCAHHWTDGQCNICDRYCTHIFFDGACIRCNITCEHEWNGRFCEKCGAECTHIWADDRCQVCGIEYRVPCAHTWTDLICIYCGITHEHMYYEGVCIVCHVAEYVEPEDTEPTPPEDTEPTPPEDTEPTPPEDTEPIPPEDNSGDYWQGYNDAISDMIINPFENSVITLVVNTGANAKYIELNPNHYTTVGKGTFTLPISKLWEIIRTHEAGEIHRISLWISFGQGVYYSGDLVDVTVSYSYIDRLFVVPNISYIYREKNVDKLVHGVAGANEGLLNGKYSYSADLTTKNIVSGLDITFGTTSSDLSNEIFIDVFENANITLCLNTLSQGVDSASYNSGYADGYKNGYDEGHDAGFDKGHYSGYVEGKLDQPEGGFENLFFALFDSMAKLFTNILDFEIFGINVSSFLVSLMSIAIVGFVIKKVV